MFRPGKLRAGALRAKAFSKVQCAGKQQHPHPRLFTQNSQLLLVYAPKFRPQLPFLHPVTGRRVGHGISDKQFRIQLARLLTTERKLFIKDQAILVGKYTVMIYVALGLLNIIGFGIRSELADRMYPNPPEWTFWTKFYWREVKRTEEPQESTGESDWAAVGDLYLKILQRLEDPNTDGADLQPLLKEEGDIYVEGVGKAGMDISAKSEPWRRGYYQCLMGMASAAEKREGWVKDIVRGIAFPAEYVLGPSNPDPRPVEPGIPAAPLEQNCEPLFESPATFYMKILTTNGFTSRQRLDAALAYADWLDFKGLHSTAEDMYDWGLDIAMGGLPQGAHDVVDIRTGIISDKAEYVSSNVFSATTGLASHHARTGNIAAGLPIFLSVLRARRKSIASIPATQKFQSEFSTSTFGLLKSILISPAYPPPPPTGDEMSEATPATRCEEAAIMSNIGEIMFASSLPEEVDGSTTSSLVPSSNRLKTQETGLAWTREAVELAEATLGSVETHDEEAQTKCRECLSMGVENWSTMIATMLKNEEAREESKRGQGTTWLWQKAADIDETKWEREAHIVDERLKSVRMMLLREEQRKQENNIFSTLFGK